MTPPDIDTARVRAGNVRVPHQEFFAIWREARDVESAADGAHDWYAAAVALTCRWMAATPLQTALCGGLPRSPATERACLANEDLIEAEWRAAQQLELHRPELASRPGWCDGVRATLRWAWRQEGPAPLQLTPRPRPPHR